jgi:hypothetical protein
MGSCIFSGEREEIGKLVSPNPETMKKELDESGGWWSTFVSGAGT